MVADLGRMPNPLSEQMSGAVPVGMSSSNPTQSRGIGARERTVGSHKTKTGPSSLMDGVRNYLDMFMTM